MNGDLFSGLVLADGRAQGLLQRQPVRTRAGGHESGLEAVAVDRAGDFDGLPRAEVLGGAA